MHTNGQRGNILFLILLAIILFVALSYAVMNQREQVGTGMSGEQLDSKAAMILQYTTLLEQTVTRLRLTGDCSDTQLSFASPTFTLNYTNSNAPADKHCHVFDPAGGGMSVNTAVFDEIANGDTNNGTIDTIFSGSAVQNVGTDCANQACNDLMVHLNLGSDANAQNLCTRINQKLGNPAAVSWSGFQYNLNYQGNYYVAPPRVLGDVSTPIMAGRRAGCYYDTSSTINGVSSVGHYVYYHVLLAR